MSRRIQCVYLVCLQQYAPCLLQYCTGAGECVKLICVSAAGRDLFSRTILESYDTSSAVQVEQVAPMVETIGPLLAVDSSICARNVSVLIRSPSWIYKIFVVIVVDFAFPYKISSKIGETVMEL